ncbi:MAG: hypothetical protein ACRDZ8_14700 [Acidimicrobiales bacterium]
MTSLGVLTGGVSAGASGTKTATTTTTFKTLPPGSALPSDATCAGLVRTAPEQRADNALANATTPPPGSFTLAALGLQNGYLNGTEALEARVTGDFTGTTDEIIQWAACKWGFDENVVRAIAMNESDWHQDEVGDVTSNAALCPPGMTAPCARSFGIHQVTWNSDPVGSFPWSEQSTAFDLDVSLLVHRICYEGDMQWLKNIGYTTYRAGDLWGCVGQWYSGNWHDAGANTYISEVQNYVSTKPWNQAGFSNVTSTTPTTSATPTTAPVTTTTTVRSTTSTTAATTSTTVAPPAAGTRYDFESGSVDRWYTGWGPLSLADTWNPVHTGSGALALTLKPSGPSWPAAQVSSPAGLASGTRVTYWVFQPAGAVITSVQPYVADVNWNDVLASPVTLSSGWNQVTWTVPPASGIKAMGLIVNDDAGWSGQLALDTVSW